MQGRSWLRLREIPPAVWALGFVSRLMDTLSEIIHALLPVYLVTVLGTSMLTVGDKPHRIVVALGYAARCIVKPWSGLKSRQFPWQDALPWAMADRHG